MSLLKKLLLVGISFFLFLISFSQVSAQQYAKVVRVVDGDTIVVSIDAKKEIVRFLGIDTPESVDPRKPVQCFATQASNKMKSLILGKVVKLTSDPTQGDKDKYKRLLRYVYLSTSKGEVFINAEMIKQGYAFSYKQYPTQKLALFNNLENIARSHSIGLWGSCSIPSKSKVSTGTLSAPRQSLVTKAPQAPAQINTTGDKDCKDFATQADAQRYFLSKGGSATNNVDRLDADHDGTACESK